MSLIILVYMEFRLFGHDLMEFWEKEEYLKLIRKGLLVLVKRVSFFWCALKIFLLSSVFSEILRYVFRERDGTKAKI